jgi:broad specificity phosphatase PhoE
MGQLTLVRHAQASFFAANYDELSPLGREQARALGEHWAATGTRFAAVHVGPLARHHQTCEIVAGVYRARGLDWPDAQLLPELDEHDGLKVARQLLGAARPQAEESAAADRERAQREYFRGYARLMRDWAAGAVWAEGAEPWPAFRARAVRALATLCATEPPAAETVVAFSSGGLVSAAVGELLGLDAEHIIDLSLVLRNTALTEVSWSRTRRRLISFNSLPHLPDPRAVTFV